MIYFPPDEFTATDAFDRDLAADYLELKAMSAGDEVCFVREIFDSLEATLELNDDRHEEKLQFHEIEDVVGYAANRVEERSRVLNCAYPFKLTDYGRTVRFSGEALNLGQCAYIVSLLLSNLSSVSVLLSECRIHPIESERKQLRTYFQYFATAAMAAEVCGSSWSFGFPRPDGSGFVEKLEEIWKALKDGTVYADPSAPAFPKDDQIDVIACRVPRDDLPGFLIAVAQVSTGRNWSSKSIRFHFNEMFAQRWFRPSPATYALAYHIIPFARPDKSFRNDVLTHGNILHRTRLPLRVEEAKGMCSEDYTIEALEELTMVESWINQYFARIKAR